MSVPKIHFILLTQMKTIYITMYWIDLRCEIEKEVLKLFRSSEVLQGNSVEIALS